MRRPLFVHMVEACEQYTGHKHKPTSVLEIVAQEASQKDIERAFGVLQAQFAIV